MTTPPLHKPLRELTAHHISPGDTVKLAVLTGPADGSPTTVVFEVWEPGGAQPLNWHADSVETFVVLAGHGRAESDEHTRDLSPGDVLVLPAGSRHRITNTSDAERLYTLTVMSPDEGFAELIERGAATPLDEADLAVLRAAA
ncbi:cupin domain-containing protein [Streptomyces hoynatensis]|uniref:Cupin domain-containing protein n=1 Tax=Streptomyces hoynatensis TaxID=1141874 RepID=A0A3A9YSW2_9ACTN|nr:cupin domain-containing protein [Streptomyces hoynatensis]RKN39045.1 cupin domain-containing protein [Streptomyces hoynatensis]